MTRGIVLFILVCILGVGLWMSPNGPVRGVFAILLLFMVVGSAIAWLSGSSRRLSGSGRDMSDAIYTTTPDADGTPHGHH
jgi:hypothetical protein